ncbi:THAP domain containing 12a [Cololabis saira]|uniref:THAP domain containing 12a n=1 Tax=Cololabis saira TaxID=129043 RepID=UPI002AD3D9E4|nr:THAP domain containing 12a [Cololabis saira]
MQKQCAAPNCPSGKSDSHMLFRFPSNPERSKKWVEKCQRNDLVDEPPEQLCRYYRLCGKHFEASAFDGDAQSTVLKDDAIPTVFDGPTQPQNGQAKRSKETTKENENDSKGKKKIKKSQADPTEEDKQAVPEEEEQKNYLKSLFEVLIVLGGQSIAPTGPADNKEGLESSNFYALLDYRMNCRDDALKKRYDVSKQYCTSDELNQLMEVCEKYVRSKVVEEVKQNGFFSLLTDDPVRISGEWGLPVFVRYLDQSQCQRERFVGFLSFEGDGDAMDEKMLSEMTDKWGLDMEQCRAQAHSDSGTHCSQMKALASKLIEKHPRAILAFRSNHALNVSLAKGMALTGVQLVMSTFKRIESFFSRSPLLQLEFEHAISIFYPEKEDKANELKEISRTNWTRRHDAFEVALDIVEALLLCVDSVHDNEDMRWNDQVTHNALEISKAVTEFECIMTLTVLKHVMVLTQAFGKHLQENATGVHLAVNSLKAVLHSLTEVSQNIDVFHEFWFDEAVNLAAAMEIPVMVPRSFLRKHQGHPGTINTQSYYKQHLSVPVVNHVIRELTEIFSEDHLKALRCLSLVPAIIEQQKSQQPEEESIQVFNDDVPNAGTLSAELHCWCVKWGKKGKDQTFPSTLHETLQLADVKFFPNMLALLRLISILPTVGAEDSCTVASKRYRMYMENMPDKVKSKSLALLNINYDVEFNLDSLVEIYMKTYPDSQDQS